MRQSPCIHCFLLRPRVSKRLNTSKKIKRDWFLEKTNARNSERNLTGLCWRTTLWEAALAGCIVCAALCWLVVRRIRGGEGEDSEEQSRPPTAAAILYYRHNKAPSCDLCGTTAATLRLGKETMAPINHTLKYNHRSEEFTSGWLIPRPMQLYK